MRAMERDKFCSVFWRYYLALEKDFMETERFVSFDLADNYLQSVDGNDLENSNVYSIEYIKQYQAIVSEIDVLLKEICKELGNDYASCMDRGYTPVILADDFWKRIVNQKVRMREIELQPFWGWKSIPYKSPAWWGQYNDVKHNRTEKYKEANLKNVLNALAGLYALENYYVKFVADKANEQNPEDKVYDVPDDESQLFEMLDWSTNTTVFGKDLYVSESIAELDGFEKQRRETNRIARKIKCPGFLCGSTDVEYLGGNQ